MNKIILPVITLVAVGLAVYCIYQNEQLKEENKDLNQALLNFEKMRIENDRASIITNHLKVVTSTNNTRPKPIQGFKRDITETKPLLAEVN